MPYSVFSSITVAGSHAQALRFAQAWDDAARTGATTPEGGLRPLRLGAWRAWARSVSAQQMLSAGGCGRAL